MKQFLFILSLIAGAIIFQSQRPQDPLTTLPKGSIIGWYSKQNVPKGWSVCNGTNGTPNLVDRFPMGTANSSEIGTKLGQATHIHNVSGTTSIPNDLTIFNGDNKALQKDGGQRVYHTHNFNVNTTEASSIPPAVKIIFIMKL